MTDHVDCADLLRRKAAEFGSDVTVSTAPPLVRSAYGEHRFTCPHGTTYWIEPTGEQVAAWAQEGVDHV